MKPHRDRRYLDYLRTCPCVVTGRYATESMAVDPAHIGPHGMGQKTDDYYAIPLLHEVHQRCHQQGESTVLAGEPVLFWPWQMLRSYELSDKDFIQCIRLWACSQHQIWKDGGVPFARGHGWI